jgi:hypothetical protein
VTPLLAIGRKDANFTLVGWTSRIGQNHVCSNAFARIDFQGGEEMAFRVHFRTVLAFELMSRNISFPEAVRPRMFI